jgi:transcriptional regulator with XRE-family HTH domain
MRCYTSVRGPFRSRPLRWAPVPGPLHHQLGANLRAIRLERGLSQEQLGQELGIDRTYVGALERGERNPSLRVVQDLADGLGVLAITLLDGDFARATSTSPVLRAAKSTDAAASRRQLADARELARRRKP